MKKLTADNLMMFAKGLEGETLETLYRPQPFQVTIDGDLFLVTTSTGKQRRAYTDQAINSICERYLKTKSLAPKDYDEFREKSYVLALIKRFMNDAG